MIINFNNYEDSGILYGGHAGDKDGIIYNGENWILKYPKTTNNLTGNIQISYTTMPLSEYIGSNIYKLLNIDTQETLLGIKSNKVVVACKDFRKAGEDLFDYNHIKNKHSEEIEKRLQEITNSTPSSITSNIDELQIIMENNPYFINNDRNEGNWGVLINRNTKEIRIAPVYDNGASFYSKSSDTQLSKILNDSVLFKNSVYNNSICAFEKNGKKINPLKLIETRKIPELNKAIKRIVPKINLDEIKNMINSIPNEFEGKNIISNIQKEFYYKSIEYIVNNILLPVYNLLKPNEIIEGNKKFSANEYEENHEKNLEELHIFEKRNNSEDDTEDDEFER